MDIKQKNISLVMLLLALSHAAASFAASSYADNAADQYGNTALISAASNGHTEAVRVLLADPRINVNAADRHG